MRRVGCGRVISGVGLKGANWQKFLTGSVAPLFDAMLAHSAEAYAVGLDLIQMYTYGDKKLLEGLRPQILLAVQKAADWELGGGRADAVHDFSEVVGWILAKGREDKDARTVAQELAKLLANTTESDDEQFIAPLVPSLLSGFPEIVWPLLGHAVLSDPLKGMGVADSFTGGYFFGPHGQCSDAQPT